jgi:UDP-N-acetylmuramyl pentapeptide phosphotransferase/UDP-N-acetylglucosamine-1-phosphate transferase
MNEEKQQHLEFVQNSIARMNENSFKIKSLTVLLATAVLTIYATNKSSKVLLLVLISSTILLWILDAYYLQQERKFRGIYDDIAGLKNINYVKMYEMPIQKYTSKKDKKFCLFHIAFSKTIMWFYFALIIICIFLSNNKSCMRHSNNSDWETILRLMLTTHV